MQLTEHRNHRASSDTEYSVSADGYETVAYFESWTEAIKYASWLRQFGIVAETVWVERCSLSR